MLGAITGDTVGSVYEFHNTKDYDFTLFLSESGYTDDSVMTMAVAYWLLKDKEHTYQGLEDSMVLFGQNCPCPMGGYGSGFYRWLFFPHDLWQFDDHPASLCVALVDDRTPPVRELRQRFRHAGECCGMVL